MEALHILRSNSFSRPGRQISVAKVFKCMRMAREIPPSSSGHRVFEAPCRAKVPRYSADTKYCINGNLARLQCPNNRSMLYSGNLPEYNTDPRVKALCFVSRVWFIKPEYYPVNGPTVMLRLDFQPQHNFFFATRK